MEIQGKTVLVSGASSGVGAAIAKAMAFAGAAEVLLLARNEDALRKVAAEIMVAGGKARIYQPVGLTLQLDRQAGFASANARLTLDWVQNAL
jgi:NADP-dependent 3-hydroxy acid dehydrogenase YdfG